MTIVIYSNSDSFKQHVNRVVTDFVTHTADLTVKPVDVVSVILIHANSYPDSSIRDFLRSNQAMAARVAIADELPDVGRMLRYTHLGVHGYCNAYMAKAHYDQLVLMINAGQSWYPPALLAQALELAHSRIHTGDQRDVLEDLTPRQQQIAMSIAQGKSNKAVADEHGISERTVKSHLTQIFEKLNVDDRVGLALYLKEHKLLEKQQSQFD